jgi:hypothetical protein
LNRVKEEIKKSKNPEEISNNPKTEENSRGSTRGGRGRGRGGGQVPDTAVDRNKDVAKYQGPHPKTLAKQESSVSLSNPEYLREYRLRRGEREEAECAGEEG